MENSPLCVMSGEIGVNLAGLLDWNGPDMVTVDQFGEQASQGGSLAGFQDIEKRLIVVIGDLRQLGKNTATLPRQGN
jgi:hypothetical protein